MGQFEFAEVEKRYTWKFPRDHGQHPAYQTEWWYFTGNLKTENDRRFGYELTFFRQALAPAILPRASAWAFRDVYIAHFSITDIERQRFYYDQKMKRGALQLANADSTLLRVDLGDWFARQENFAKNGNSAGAGNFHLHAASAFGQIDLVLQSTKPVVFHGDHGLLRNSDLRRDAAYYHSLTSLKTKGILAIEGEPLRVEGWSWMDHEFFTPIANPAMAGWDWLSLHLSDSTEIMLAHLRLADGSISSYSVGTVIYADGVSQHLSMRDFAFTPQSWWTSPLSGGKYPVEWKVKFLDYDLQLSTPVKNQELDTRPTTGRIYWEGCVEVVGEKSERKIKGEGYLEMTGYAK